MNYKHFVFLILIGILSACSKPLLTKNTLPCKFRLTPQAEMLVDKAWRETSIEAKKDSGDSTHSSKGFKNITGQFHPSDLDDIVMFSRKGTYLFDEGKEKARPEGAQVYESGKWCICNDGAQLVLANGPSLTVYQIIEVEENSLILKLQRTNEKVADTYLLTYRPF